MTKPAHRSLALAALLTLACTPAALAQTTLNLAATGQAEAKPDQTIATLTAQATSFNPATAQNEVNTAMKAALDLTAATPGVTATTANYNVSQIPPQHGNGPNKFQVSEDLNLVVPISGGPTANAFSALLGRLQDKGFLLGDFEGSLSPAGQNAAEQAAIKDAMAQIKAQSTAVATALGETVSRTTTVSLNTAPPGPEPLMAPAPMMMTKSFTPPQAAPANVTITASVTATVLLAGSESK